LKPALLLALFVTVPLWPQAADDGVPDSSNVLNAQYPRLHPDNSATFRVKAPDAQKVEVQVGADSKRYPLVKGSDGVWTGSTEPLVPGFHYYFLVIDGVQVSDPASQSFFGYGKASSGIEVPEKGVNFYQPRRRARSAFTGTTPKSRGRGADASSIRLLVTTPTRVPAIPFSISSTAQARMRPAGPRRAASTSSSIT
jgi:hypothetical protein